MEFNLLAISAGNTRTRFGSFVQGQLTGSVAISHDDAMELSAAIDEAYAPLSRCDDTILLLASVHPGVTERLMDLAPRQTGCKPLRVEEDMRIPIGRQLDREAIVGEDRLLNAAAAYDVLKQACVIVDAGTAITVDFVDGAGTFHGGAIAPGAQMMLDALHERTAQLPPLELSPPKEAIGHNTAEAMFSGVYHGVRGMVRELVEQFATGAGAYPMVIATGGNANLLFKDFPLVERIVPDLTLMGMAVTVRAALEQQRGDSDGDSHG